ncbi:hypothetical protein FH972_011764 [Carpinus fangiana]|uniref:Uncharacterized protein n=1 Tax=Carpinus fangiana TaxID=176857 RepID=A0A660KSA6_9ROSI|nr:hypothetical protein FH972_011764 [Carpinus fangiana]
MDSAKTYPSTVCHVVAMPYPGRGHINPMMNLCKLLASKMPQHILVTFVVTEEWLGFIGSDPKPNNIRFATVPNVIPSELGRAKDFPGFVEAVSTKMEAPFEELLDRLEPPVTAIVADTYVVWAIRVGNRRNIPVASLWPMSATLFSVLHHFELLVQHGHFPIEVSERGNELVDYIPGVSAMRIVDLPTFMYGAGREVLHRALECVSLVSKAQYLLFTSVQELEAEVIDTLKVELPFPVYPIGPAIPYFELQKNSSIMDEHIRGVNYFRWLDCQPTSSVLYVSLGSFLSVSSAQMDEIASGLRDSGVRRSLIRRNPHQTSPFREIERVRERLAVEPVEKEIPAKWVPMGFTGMGLLVHRNGFSAELESGSDFDFSFAFDNNVSDPTNSNKPQNFLVIFFN